MLATKHPQPYCAGNHSQPKPTIILTKRRASTNLAKDKSTRISLPRYQTEYSRRPIQSGIIQHWDGIEQLWQRTLNDELLVPTVRQPLLLTEIVINPKSCRQKTAQIVFESLEAPGLYLAIPSVLSMYTSGSLTGIGLSCGGDYSGLVPVYEGIALRRSAPFLPFAGRELDAYLWQMLHQRGYDVDMGVARDIKEKLCYVVSEPPGEEEAGLNLAISSTYELPDGQIINVCQERHMVPEAMFNSDILRLPPFRGLLGAHGLIARTTDVSIRNDLYANVVLVSGGSLQGESNFLIRKLTRSVWRGLQISRI